MPAGRLAAVFAALVLAGCAETQSQAPVLGNPKILLDRTGDDRTQIYVHGAVSEREYDLLVVAVDNETIAEARHAYAVAAKTDATAFTLDVRAWDGFSNYTARALVRLSDNETEPHRIALWDPVSGTFEEFRSVGLPWQKIADEIREPEADV